MRLTRKQIIILFAAMAVIACGILVFVKLNQKPAAPEDELETMEVYESTSQQPVKDPTDPSTEKGEQVEEISSVNPSDPVEINMESQNAEYEQSLRGKLDRYMETRLMVMLDSIKAEGMPYDSFIDLANACFARAVDDDQYFKEKTIEDMYNTVVAMSDEEALVGDIVFYLDDNGKPYDAAIYVGDNQVRMLKDGTCTLMDIDEPGVNFKFGAVLINKNAKDEEMDQAALTMYGYLPPIIPNFTEEQLELIDGKAKEFGFCLANHSSMSLGRGGESDAVEIVQVDTSKQGQYIFYVQHYASMYMVRVVYYPETQTFVYVE